MVYRFLADLVLVLHLAFVLFALLGGLLVLHRPKLLPWHLGALTWGMIVQIANWICPLTHLENQFRYRGGEAGYTGSFIEHLITPVLYPDLLTLELRYLLALGLALVNLAVYAVVLLRWKRRWQRMNNCLAPQSNQSPSISPRSSACDKSG